MYENSQKTEICRKKSLVLFDFDGTLCAIDSYSAFLKSVYPKHHFYRKCLGLLPEICGYYLGYYPAHLLRPKLSKAFLNGLELSHLEAKLENFTTKILQQLTPVVYQKLLWHRQQGHTIYIVSAGLDLYLSSIAQQLNVNLICSQIKMTSTLTGAYQSADCSNLEKVRRVKQVLDLSQFNCIYAYGNSDEDNEMLAIADHAWRVKGNSLQVL